MTNHRQRARLHEVYLDWRLQRFSERGMKEVEQMLIGQLPSFRETQAGKELIAIGNTEGRDEGREKGIEKGIEKGELIGQIRVLRELLGDEPTESHTLALFSVMDLTSCLAELRARFKQR